MVTNKYSLYLYFQSVWNNSYCTYYYEYLRNNGSYFFNVPIFEKINVIFKKLTIIEKRYVFYSIQNTVRMRK